MADPTEAERQERRKITFWLMAAGAVSLAVPLLGALYLHISQSASPPAPSGRSDLFEHRDGDDRKITPSQTAVIMPAPSMPSPMPGKGGPAGGSSLDFIKSNDDLTAKPAEPAKAAVAAPAPAAPAVSTAPAAASGKPARKAFAPPKLQSGRGFTKIGGGKSAPDSAGGQDSSDIMKNLPPGSENNPEVQKYLQSQGK